MTQKLRFEFAVQEIVAEPGTYAVMLPAKISTKQELLQELYEHLQLPGYFGFNWDALSECLQDFHWLESRCIILVHSDLPGLPPDEQRSYLSILAEAQDYWNIEGGRSFRVVFPAVVINEVTSLLET